MKSLIATGFVIASLALAANAAMAANAPVHHAAKAVHVARTPAKRVAHAPAPVHVAARKYQPRAQLNFDIGQFIQSMLGGRVPDYANLVRDAARAPVSHESGSYSPSYDYSSPVDPSTNNTQALADQENQEIQEMNDTNALTASMAAAEEENDEANAATLQTEINAGM